MSYTPPSSWNLSTTLWIKTDGDDGLNGLSEANALATWAAVRLKINSTASRLWTINVVPGSWTLPDGGVLWNVMGNNSRLVIQPSSGSSSNITITASATATA